MAREQPGQPLPVTRAPGPLTGWTARYGTQPSGSAIIVTGAVLAVMVMATLIIIGRPPVPEAATAPPSAPPLFQEPQPPIPLLSDPPTPSPSASASRTTAAHAAASTTRPAARTSSSSRTPERLLPAPGDRLSLLATGTTDLRLRHQDFRMKLASIGPGSPAGDRADATFVLRRGLADASCVTLESVNYPGRFMRHQNFAVLLQPRDASPLFAADATFCPRATGGSGSSFVLRSVNYPDRYLTADGRLLALSRVSAGSAQSFRAAPAL
jgi:hypothetical protein